ncbi:MAG: Spy/CpxP family protein refolding chaperone [Candidatus Thiothrix sulfatifontis]|nr:MAG: Spy/CpxP family protein refolding chaperone [Candidatus Thiothrix sulfatifontis]
MLKPISYLLLSAALVGVAVADDAAKTTEAHAMPAATAAVPIDAEAAAKQATMKNMMHANPMPNYMVIIRKEADTLKLNDEQKAKVDGWFNENNSKAAEVVTKIVAAEQAFAEASMSGTSEADLMKQFDEMAAMRRALAEQKTKCRDHMQTVLTPEQWTQVVSLQKASMTSK